MKLKLFITVIFFANIIFGQVGIGTDTPHSSAILELSSSNKALLLPRLASTTEVTNPTNGMLIYDLSTECVKFYENSAWTGCLSSANKASVRTLSYIGTSDSRFSAGSSYNANVKIAYTGANGISYNDQTISSTGVTGLTATLSPGTLSKGSGSFTLTIKGIPSSTGVAQFVLNFGGQQCVFTHNVETL